MASKIMNGLLWKKSTFSIGLCVTTENDFFSVIKTAGGSQILLDRAFWFFFKAEYEKLLYSLY